jgi:hypothetical protein
VSRWHLLVIICAVVLLMLLLGGPHVSDDFIDVKELDSLGIVHCLW